jgi:phosphatidylglycerol:prolipoprotein diacylglycerol transferase
VQPVLFQLGPVTVRYYGLMYVMALLVAIALLRYDAKRYGLSSERVVDLAFYTFLAGIVGGRLYYVMLRWDYYGHHLWKIFAVWEGGMAIHGGLIGGLIGIVWFARVVKVPALCLADLIAPTVSLGHAFGRFGNFMNGDAHGYPLRSPWLPEWLRHFPSWMGVTFPPTSPAGRQFPNQPLHPVMLYELVLNLLGFGLLWGLRKRPFFTRTPGRLLGLYLIYYAAVRSFTSLFRADDLYLGPFRMPHVIGLAMALIGLFLLLRRGRRTPSPETVA